METTVEQNNGDASSNRDENTLDNNGNDGDEEKG